MNSISPTYLPAEHCSLSSHRTVDHEMNRIINSTWHVLEQTPPPTLREVLGAYRLRGDGDRDMLIAMLNAKSAEDQRIASVAALHRTLLDVQYPLPPPAHLPLSPYHVQPNSRFDSPPTPPTMLRPTPTHNIKRSRPRSEVIDDIPIRRSPPSSAVREQPSHPSPAESSRKRRRTSHTSSSSTRAASRGSHSTASHDSPRSAHSSVRSDSSEYSPRSRTSMAIGSLLSSDSGQADTYRREHNPDRNMNGYISPPNSLGPISV